MKKKITIVIMVLLGLFIGMSQLRAEMLTFDQDQLDNMYRNIAVENFNTAMDEIQRYYILLQTDSGTIKRSEYMEKISDIRKTITENYNPGNTYPLTIEYGVYLELYVDYINNISIEERDAYLPLNSQLVEYFQNSLLQARADNLTAEIKIYQKAVSSLTYLVGRA